MQIIYEAQDDKGYTIYDGVSVDDIKKKIIEAHKSGQCEYMPDISRLVAINIESGEESEFPEELKTLIKAIYNECDFVACIDEDARYGCPWEHADHLYGRA